MFRPICRLLLLLIPVCVVAESLRLRAPFAVEVDLPSAPVAARASTAADDAEWLELSVRGSAEPWEFSHRLALEVEPGTAWQELIHGRPLKFSKTVTANLVLLEAASPRAALQEAAWLGDQPGVRSALPVCRRPAALGFAYAPRPTDEFFTSQVQWVVGQSYLENRKFDSAESTGVDVNARGAWAYTLGLGVGVAVGDQGIELTHPELAERLTGMPHFNFATGQTNGLPTGFDATAAHGTSCAGLIAGIPNNGIGMSGLAPEARVASWVVFRANRRLADDASLAKMYAYAPDQVAVQNHSWGNASAGQVGPTALERTGIEKAWQEGRGGKGSVLVRIAGNGRTENRNANDDGWSNDPRAICVAGVRSEGRVASYSSAGACILVAAPGGDYDLGGLYTTDLSDSAGANFISFFPPYEYLSGFRFNATGFIGTSAAAPLVSATAALMLSANPALTARDVQQILLLSARQHDLGDPTLVTNAAGLPVSHYTGFGVIDAGEAVRLARRWVNRPGMTTVRLTNSSPSEIADSQLLVEMRTAGLPLFDLMFAGLPGTGLQPDAPIPFLKLVDIGLATNVPGQSLAGAGALIERGTNDFSEKLANAAAAGAKFAVVYNYAEGPADTCPPGEQLCPLGGTDFAPIPAIFIRRSAGLALRERIQTDPLAVARLIARGDERVFTVTRALSCEHVQVRLQTDHPLRGDLRVVLTSPGGVHSVLQTYGTDTNAGPADWTYMTVQHFFEPTVGDWKLAVIDEGEGETGTLLNAELILHGTPITDADRDGLDDTWERDHFGALARSATDDADNDGYSDLREFVAGSNPNQADFPFALNFSEWNAAVGRLSWPGAPGRYRIFAGEEPGMMEVVGEVDGMFPETVWYIPVASTYRFYRVERL